MRRRIACCVGHGRRGAPLAFLRRIRRPRAAPGGEDDARRHRLAHHAGARSAPGRPRADPDGLQRRPVPRIPGRGLGVRVPAHGKHEVRGQGARAASHLRDVGELGLRRGHEARPVHGAHAARHVGRVRLDPRDAQRRGPRDDLHPDRHRGGEGRGLPAERVVDRPADDEPQLDRHRRPGDDGPGAVRRGRARGRLAVSGGVESGASAGVHRAHPGRQLARRAPVPGLWAGRGAAVLAGDAARRRGLHRHGAPARIRPVHPLRRHPRISPTDDPALRRLHQLAGPGGAGDQPLHRVGSATGSPRRRRRGTPAGSRGRTPSRSSGTRSSSSSSTTPASRRRTRRRSRSTRRSRTSAASRCTRPGTRATSPWGSRRASSAGA